MSRSILSVFLCVFVFAVAGHALNPRAGLQSNVGPFLSDAVLLDLRASTTETFQCADIFRMTEQGSDTYREYGDSGYVFDCGEGKQRAPSKTCDTSLTAPDGFQGKKGGKVFFRGANRDTYEAAKKFWEKCQPSCCVSGGKSSKSTGKSVVMSSIFAIVEGQLKDALGVSCKNSAQALYEYLNLYSPRSSSRDKDDEPDMPRSYGQALRQADLYLNQLMVSMEQTPHNRKVSNQVKTGAEAIVAFGPLLPVTATYLGVKYAGHKIQKKAATSNAFTKTFLRALSASGFAMFEEAIVRSDKPSAALRANCEAVFDRCVAKTERSVTSAERLGVDVNGICALAAEHKGKSDAKTLACDDRTVYKASAIFWERLHRRYNWLSSNKDKRQRALSTWYNILTENADNMNDFVTHQAEEAVPMAVSLMRENIAESDEDHDSVSEGASELPPIEAASAVSEDQLALVKADKNIPKDARKAFAASEPIDTYGAGFCFPASIGAQVGSITRDVQEQKKRARELNDQVIAAAGDERLEEFFKFSGREGFDILPGDIEELRATIEDDTGVNGGGAFGYTPPTIAFFSWLFQVQVQVFSFVNGNEQFIFQQYPDASLKDAFFGSKKVSVARVFHHSDGSDTGYGGHYEALLAKSKPEPIETDLRPAEPNADADADADEDMFDPLAESKDVSEHAADEAIEKLEHNVDGDAEKAVKSKDKAEPKSKEEDVKAEPKTENKSEPEAKAEDKEGSGSSRRRRRSSKTTKEGETESLTTEVLEELQQSSDKKSKSETKSSETKAETGKDGKVALLDTDDEVLAFLETMRGGEEEAAMSKGDKDSSKRRKSSKDAATEEKDAKAEAKVAEEEEDKSDKKATVAKEKTKEKNAASEKESVEKEVAEEEAKEEDVKKSKSSKDAKGSDVTSKFKKGVQNSITKTRVANAFRDGTRPSIFSTDSLASLDELHLYQDESGKEPVYLQPCAAAVFPGAAANPELCVMLDHYILAMHALHEERWRGSTASGVMLDKFMEVFAIYGQKILKISSYPEGEEMHACALYASTCKNGPQPQNYHQECNYALPKGHKDHCSVVCCLEEEEESDKSVGDEAEEEEEEGVNQERMCERMSSVVDYVLLHLEGNNVRANEALRKWDQALGMFNGLLQAGAAAGGAAAGGALGASAAGAVSGVVTSSLSRLSENTATKAVKLGQMSRNMRLAFLKSIKSMYFSNRRRCFPLSFVRNLYHIAFAPRGPGTAKALSSMFVLRQMAVREYGKDRHGVGSLIGRGDMGTSVRGVAADEYLINRLAVVSTDKFIGEYLGANMAAQFSAHQNSVRSLAQSNNKLWKVFVRGGSAAISGAVVTKLNADHLAQVRAEAADQSAKQSFVLGQIRAGKTPDEALAAWETDQANRDAAEQAVQ